ncbi:MAG: formylglycine-generating enzyme family protein, partial [Vicinamibacteria bacterium]
MRARASILVLTVAALGASTLAGQPRLAAQAATAKTVDDGYGVFVHVPAGAFTMGDTFGDGDGRERPDHTVEVDAFYIGKFEVTNAQWRRFRDDPGYDDPKLWPDGRVMPKTQI